MLQTDRQRDTFKTRPLSTEASALPRYITAASGLKGRLAGLPVPLPLRYQRNAESLQASIGPLSRGAANARTLNGTAVNDIVSHAQISTQPACSVGRHC